MNVAHDGPVIIITSKQNDDSLYGICPYDVAFFKLFY